MVVEDTDGEATRLADVYVYGFDGLLLLIDAESVSARDRAELVASAAKYTESIYQGTISTVGIAGNGYQIQLPGCREAGFALGDTAPTAVEHGVIVVHDGGNARLAQDLLTIRDTQVSSVY